MNNFIVIYRAKGKDYPQSMLVKIIDKHDAWTKVASQVYAANPDCEILQITVWG